MNQPSTPSPDRLKWLREQAGMSQTDLAVRLCVITGTSTLTRHEISRWERGRRKPTAWLEALAVALDVRVHDLLATPHREMRDKGITRPAPNSGEGVDLATMRSFRSADVQVGGGHLYATVMGYLRANIAPRLFGSQGTNDVREVFAAAGGLTEMAGWMAHDAGHDALAGQHFRRSLDLANAGGDHQLKAHIYASLSHLSLHLDEPHDAIELSRRGKDVLASAPAAPQLSARLYAMEARGLAALGNPSASVRALGRAEMALSKRPAEPPSPWASSFDVASLSSETARSLHQLDQLEPAEEAARRILELRSGTHLRSRAFGQLLLIRILIDCGRLDEACTLATQVLDSTESLSSHQVTQQLRDLHSALQPFIESSPVREVLPALVRALSERLDLYRWLNDRASTPG